MRILVLAGFLMATTGWAQEPVPVPLAPEPQAQEQVSASPQKQTITVPAGTRVAVTLTNPIRSRLTKKGDAIRVVTAFPVTVGTQVAIPAGTYLEGVIDKVTKGGRSARAGLDVHFTRMVFSSGYTVALDGATAQAKATSPGTALPGAPPSDSQSAMGSAMALQQPTQPPPPPKLGPSIGLVTGISLGATAAITVGAILLGRHHGGDVLFDSGYQFDLVLQNPVTLDADSVTAALNGPSAQ